MTLMMDRILKYRIFIPIILLMGMAPITGFAAQQKNVRVSFWIPLMGERRPASLRIRCAKRI